MKIGGLASTTRIMDKSMKSNHFKNLPDFDMGGFRINYKVFKRI